MTDLAVTASNVVVGATASVLYGSCGETVTAGQAVYQSSATKKWLRADSNSPEAEVRRAIGIALNGGSLNQPLRILRRGKVTIGGILTPGVNYYLSDNPGGICQAADVVAGDYICLLGIATSATVLDVKIRFPNVASTFGGFVQVLGAILQTAAATVSGAAARNIQATQSLGGTGQTAIATVTTGPNWFVDSVAGSDSNNGTSTATPFASLSKVNAMVAANPTQKHVALKRGSYWREMLGVETSGDPNAWPSGSKVVDYGSGVVPVIDATNIASNGSFSLTGGQTKTYQINWANSFPAYSGKEFFSAWENGVRLIRATSIANCEATAGSCYAPDPTGTSPQLIYIHATNDSNVSTNGRTYEITARLYAIGFAGVNGATVGSSVDGVVGLRVRRGGHNDGTIILGQDVTLKGVISQEGRLHNFLMSSGTATDCYSWKLEPGASGTGWVAFANAAAGLSMNWVRCYHIANTDAASPTDEFGFYGHSVSTQFSLLSFTDCFSYYCFGGFDGISDSINISRCGTDQVLLPVTTGTTTLALDDCYFKMNNPAGGARIFSPTGRAGTISNNRIELIVNYQYVFWAAGSWTINNNTIVNTVSSYSDIIHTNDTSSSVDFRNNILQGCHNILNSSEGTMTLGTWDNNVYHDDGGGQYWTFNANPFANGLAAWKTLSGKETNSITSDPLFTGSPSAGDFTLQGGSPAIAISAGATNDAARGRWAMPVWATIVSNLGSW